MREQKFALIIIAIIIALIIIQFCSKLQVFLLQLKEKENIYIELTFIFLFLKNIYTNK